METNQIDYTKILESMVNGLYIYNIETSTNDYINLQYTSITGWTLDEINSMGEEFLKLFHPDDVDEVLAHMEAVTTSKEDKTFTVEYRFKHKDGHWVWCLSYDTPFDRDQTGKSRKFVGSFIDITEQKESRNQLEQKIGELKKMNDAMVDRELAMTKMKTEVDELLTELGRPTRYSSPTA